MANLDIYIKKEDGRTYTNFQKYWYHSHISFHNLEATPANPGDPEAILTVTVAENILCKGKQSVTKIVVAPGAAEKYKICEVYAGGPFKYTSQIGTSTPEDPIIIIEKHFVSPVLVGAVVVVGASLAIGALLGNYFATRRARPRT